ncbi:carbohydrate kinase [Demequina capsici]|uniref:Carbohydrate kinase n=1 Tax=Demequina capsici TaxID=3075620 RepID=A0AA96FGA1_9MICO|nr:carbohydrate kinase [Demequina sp. PMTSA13]WNM27986.1 carbohydrate kinase [Demequina sp. PMTSA13]
MSGHALVIGEALIDAVHRADGSVQRHPGGSPANVAIGLARLGRDAELLTWLGKDDDGALVVDHLEGSGVALCEGSQDAPATSVATATLDASGAAAYDFALEWALSADAVTRPEPLVVHTGSIAAVLQPGADAVLTLMASSRETSTVTYDPNARPSLMGEPATARAAVERAVRLADVVKVSDEDIEWLAPGEGVDRVAQAWLALGPAIVVVTRGGEGATAWTPEGRVDVRAPKVTVADTVGAGDSFMGGLIDGLWGAGVLGAPQRQALRSLDLDTVSAVLERCARIAAITVSRAGANPPTLAELDA